MSNDGARAACRRNADSGEFGAGHHKPDKNGADVWIYRLAPDPIGMPLTTPALKVKADPEKCHRVYDRLLKALTLAASHRASLRGRGFTDAQIDQNGYRSLGRDRHHAVRAIEDAGLGEMLPEVPGFWFDGGRWKLKGASGIIVPVRRFDGQIIALKIRLDDPGDGPKYLYLSSKKFGGPGPGSPAHVPLGEFDRDVIRITEGELKADICTAKTQVLTVSVGGANNFRTALGVLERIKPSKVLMAFDSDATTNADVARSVRNCFEAVCAKFKTQLEVWNLDDGKGLDDLLKGGKTPRVLTGQEAADWLAALPGDAGPTKDVGRRLPSRLPEVVLPGGSMTITEAAGRVGKLLGETGEFYVRGGMVMRLENDPADDAKLVPVKAAALCSDLEQVARLVRVQQTKDGQQITPANRSESTARLILDSAAFRSVMPAINVLSKCPVLIERDGQLIQVAGYDRQSGIMAKGSEVAAIDVSEARARLFELLADFDFATPGDRARALAAIITPALVFGGLLRGRAPIDMGEADNSQSGKGFRNKLTAAVYGVTVKSITQQPNGGVGSLKESFDATLVEGHSMIAIDNLRGKLDLPAFESFATEDSYRARIPYSPGVEIDPRRIVLLMTSNRAEMTIDLANRSSVVRIRKRPDAFQFATYPEGDILDRAVAKPGYYLAAVFSVVQEWHRRGMPEIVATGHDFRRWARVLGYITDSILGAGDLLADHRAIQERIASPGLNWLRDVALAVQRNGRLGEWLRANQLLQIIQDNGIDTPGIEQDADTGDDAEWLKAVRKIGMKMGKLLAGGPVSIDTFHVEREKRLDNSFREQTEYAFFSEPPKSPEPTPEVKAENPEPPEPPLTVA